MSDTVMIAIVAAVPATIAALVGAFNLRKTNVVHDAVNGGLAEARTELKAANAEIQRLKAQRDRRRGDH